ncbi:hypothetical protein BH11CYA1_BH11CYA1_02610 [soil metagenome]
MQQAQLSLFKVSALAALLSFSLPLSVNSCPQHAGSQTDNQTQIKTKSQTSDSKTAVPSKSDLISQSGTDAQSTKNKPSAGKSREGFNQPLILSGLKQMKLVIGELDQFSIDHGITKEKIRHLIVDELVPTHTTICDDGDCCSGKGCEPAATPILYLKLKTVPESASSNTASFSINMSLVEKVRVSRNKQELMVAVWSKDASGNTQSNMQSEIDNQLKEVVKHFRRDFALANSADIGHGRKHPLKKDSPTGMPDVQD